MCWLGEFFFHFAASRKKLGWNGQKKEKQKILQDQLTIWQLTQHIATFCQTKCYGETKSNKQQQEKAPLEVFAVMASKAIRYIGLLKHYSKGKISNQREKDLMQTETL